MEQKRYSEMTEYELKQEIANVMEKARKAEQLGMINEYAVLERKAMMAKAYLLNPNDYQPKEIYEIDGNPISYFQIEYINGVFAWGYRLGESTEIEGIPISMLRKLTKA